MLNKFERQKRELMIFIAVSATCAVLLLTMLMISWADLIVVHAPVYQRQIIELSKCKGELEEERREEIGERWEVIEVGP